jgi:hypothetical protein
VQVLYNKAKTGVDGVTQWTNFFRSQTSKLKWEQNVGTKCLRRVYLGGFIAYRLVSNKSYVLKKGEYKGLSKLREKLNSFMSMGAFVDDGTKDLLILAQELSNGKAVPVVQCTIVGLGAPAAAARQHDDDTLWEVKEKGRTSTGSKKKLFNKDPYKGVRLDLSLGHFPVKYEKSPKNCAYCNKSKKQVECCICGMVLCCNDNCFKEWHTCSNLL